MRLRLIAAAVFLLPLAMAAVASAQQRGAAAAGIQFYFAPEDSTPALAGEYLRSHPSEAMRMVTITLPGRDPREEFYSVGPITRSPRGVCRFSVSQIFPHVMEGAPANWDRMPPNATDYVQPTYAMGAAVPTMGAAAPAPCPRQDDASYVTLDQDITDAELIETGAFWKDVTSTQAKFDTASGLLPLILSDRIGRLFESFRMRVLQPSDRQPQLRAVLRHMGQGYDLGFSDAPGEATSSFVTIARSRDGYSILNFQTYLR